MTRILVLTNMYPPHHYGGYELACHDVVERLRQRGHDVTVLTSTVRVAGAPTGREPGVRRQLRLYWSDHRLLAPSLPCRLRMERENQRVLTEALGAVRPDVVSVWNMGALSFGLLTTLVERRMPLVHVVCGDWLEFGPRMDPWSRLFIGRSRLAAAARRLSGVPTGIADLGQHGTYCFVSSALRREAELGSPWHFADSAVVPLGIEPSEFPTPSDAGHRPWRWRLLYVGRIDPRKGIDTALHALSLLPAEATLEVCGRGDHRHLGELHQLMGRLGLFRRVRFTVAEHRAALASLYRAADAVIFPSTWNEPFGLVPLEAMATATPVVATGTGGSGEYLRDGANCLLFPPGDEQAAARALGRLAAEPDLRLRLVEGGLATAARFSVEALVNDLERRHRAAAQATDNLQQ